MNLQILPISDHSFRQYGQRLEGYDVEELLQLLESITPLPEAGVVYQPAQPELEALPIAKELSDRAYGGMPIQLGWCNGHNTKLNCLEYHRDSELNLGSRDFILLLAKREDMEDGYLDTEKVKAFLVPAGVLVEVYATSLHYAPCQASRDTGFRVMVGLPLGTNMEKPDIRIGNSEDSCLWAKNKWLLAHAESNEAAAGAPVMLKGKNLDIEELI